MKNAALFMFAFVMAFALIALTHGVQAQTSTGTSLYGESSIGIYATSTNAGSGINTSTPPGLSNTETGTPTTPGLPNTGGGGAAR